MSESLLWKVGESIKTVVAGLPSEVGGATAMFSNVFHGYLTPNDSSSANVPFACVDVARETTFDVRDDGVSGYVEYPISVFAYFRQNDADVGVQTKVSYRFISVMARAIARQRCEWTYGSENIEEVVIRLQNFRITNSVPESGNIGGEITLANPYYAVVCELLVRINTMAI